MKFGNVWKLMEIYANLKQKSKQQTYQINNYFVGEVHNFISICFFQFSDSVMYKPKSVQFIRPYFFPGW